MPRLASIRVLFPSSRSFQFRPRSYSISNAHSPIASSQIFTLPHIPELYDPNFLDVLLPPKAQEPEPTINPPPKDAPKNATMDALVTTAHRTYTQNDAKAYDSTLSPMLDAFNALNARSVSSRLDTVLTKAWKEDPQLTLRLIWQLRSIHEGKSEKEGFYRAFGWLYEHHPRTAILNLPMLVSPVCRDKARPDVGRSHGYWKDLLNILALATTDGLHQHKPPFLHTIQKKESRLWKALHKKAREESGSVSAEEAKVVTKERRARQAEWRYTKLDMKLEDKKYLALYVAVARLFSEQLLKDLRLLVEIQGLDSTEKQVHELTRELSLAGKWAPTSSLSHDRYTNITSAIALLIYHSRNKIPNLAFPSVLRDSSVSSISTVRPSMTILRSYMQRWILTPLRAVTQVTEPLMTAQKWTSIQYNRVPSLCMQRNMEHFYRHDPTGFEKYLIDVESGKQHISGATLLPHTLALKAIELGWAVELSKRLEKESSTSLATRRAKIKAKIAEPQLRVVEAQWNTIIERIRESGALEGSLAICDVSGSMGSLYGRPARGGHPDPIVPAVALSLVLTQLAKPPFDQGYITFSKDPKFVKVEKGEGMGLYESLMYIQDTDPGLNTDFEKVFLGLLPLAKEKKVPREDIPKRLFVFSDMQFDEARRDGYGYVDDQESQRGPAEAWRTSYDAVKGHFEEAGYEVPEIVFWDLAGHGTVEVDGEREGVAMMNGFSPNMMKVFMGEEAEAAVEGEEKRVEKEEVFNPVNVMRKAVMKQCFDGLVVVD